jgi:hypothetical protein
MLSEGESVKCIALSMPEFSHAMHRVPMPPHGFRARFRPPWASLGHQGTPRVMYVFSDILR